MIALCQIYCDKVAYIFSICLNDIIGIQIGFDVKSGCDIRMHNVPYPMIEYPIVHE